MQEVVRMKTKRDLELKKMAENLYKEMFNENLELDNVKFNSRISRKLGYVKAVRFYGSDIIQITELGVSDKLIHDMDKMILTIKHELVHIYCMRKYKEVGHGYYFKKIAIKFKIYYYNKRTGRFMFTCA